MQLHTYSYLQISIGLVKNSYQYVHKLSQNLLYIISTLVKTPCEAFKLTSD